MNTLNIIEQLTDPIYTYFFKFNNYDLSSLKRSEFDLYEYYWSDFFKMTFDASKNTIRLYIVKNKNKI
jgi:hypothetical protein